MQWLMSPVQFNQWTIFFMCCKFTYLKTSVKPWCALTAVAVWACAVSFIDKRRIFIYIYNSLIHYRVHIFSTVCLEDIPLISWEKYSLKSASSSQMAWQLTQSQYLPLSARTPLLLSFKCHFVWYTGVRAREECRQRFGLVRHLLYHIFV